MNEGEQIIIFFACREYRPMPALDRYDPELLDDDADLEELSVDGRMEAEAEMRRRDQMEGRNVVRMRKGLLYGNFFCNIEP